jgi:hypothetical protein
LILYFLYYWFTDFAFGCAIGFLYGCSILVCCCVTYNLDPFFYFILLLFCTLQVAYDYAFVKALQIHICLLKREVQMENSQPL